MGEYADYEIERMLSGRLPRAHKPRPTLVACKFCQARNLSWKQTEDGWRLHEGDVLHTCQAYTEARAEQLLREREEVTQVPPLHKLRPGYRPKYHAKPPQCRPQQPIGVGGRVCPHCGTRYGMAFGTGDCWCDSEPDSVFHF